MNASNLDKKGKILIVDDLPENLNLLTVMLTQEGYEVRRAPNGQLALSSAPRFQPDLILLDIMMPGMDGYEVCGKLKTYEQTRQIPIIFLSALNETFDKVKAFNLGGADYITKPFQIEEVLVRVDHQLQIQRLQSQLQAQNEDLRQEVQERKRAEDDAQRASQAKSEFLARMSHELRSPLSAILGYSELLLSTVARSEDDRSALDAIMRSGQHLLTLIDDILSMTKIETGHLTLNEDACDLEGLILDLQQMFDLQATQKGLKLQTDCAPDVPDYIQADEIKLRQVLINLLSNAIKFTTVGRITLKVWVGRQDDSIEETLSRVSPSPAQVFPSTLPYPVTLKFLVEDTGMGIATEELGKLFQPFEQTATGRQLKKGSGLGLAISREFVRLMGGEIQVHSDVNCGSCFSFSIKALTIAPPEFPAQLLNYSLAELEDSPLLDGQSELNDLGDAADSNHNCRILIADEVETNRFLLASILTRSGFRVREASNGQEAIEVWSDWQPHLIFMDLHMPILDGYEATQIIRQMESENNLQSSAQTYNLPNSERSATGSSTKILALTADVLPENHKKAKDMGCDDVVLKPYRMNTLLAKIREHL